MYEVLILLGGDSLVDPRVDLPRVSFVYFLLIFSAEANTINIPLGIVVIEARSRIDAAHGAYHLRSKKDVVHRNNFEEQINAGLVIHTRIKKYVVANHLSQRWPL